MRKPICGITPTQWLAALGIPTAKIAEILSSYKTGTNLQLYTYSAPHLFLRFHGANSIKPIFAPNYWADESAFTSAFNHATQFEGFLTDDEIRNIAKSYYRNITAICHNWNPLDSDTFWKITLCGSETVEGLEGEVGMQPTHAKTDTASASTSLLHGGGVQVFLNPKTPFICTPVRWN
jgi:hypothetical protein